MLAVMEPALDVLDRSLQGDPGALSFLDRTSSIYVLDATDMSKPKTYGCWNFIHQAINEIERAEAALTSTTLSAHVQLLANMALRVARRSNELDKHLVATCIENAAKYHGSASDTQKLIDINVEIRDIVMGRIAALALDPSFHRQGSLSTFSDTVVMEMFCAVLAANAVSNGPAAVNHLISEWILPSAVNLPPFCLSCITLHLGFEASRKSAPAGTQDMLQQVSSVVMAGVLAPVLSEAIKESNSNTEATSGLAYHERNCRVAALSLNAMDQWCAATDLSLAQIRHVCNKVMINIVDVLSDAMYSDSSLVVDALAELIEGVVARHQVPTVSDERMTQVRYIMQVDEASFRSNITKNQLVTIESKEMFSILEELVSAIGLQRFRFFDRQNKGDDGVCRNLARIGCSICSACVQLSCEGRQLNTGPGLLDLLMKSASHPSVNICGIAIDVLRELISSENGMYNQLLPVLQRRAITPHHVVDEVISLEATDICGVNYHEFENFRATVLKNALITCMKGNEEHYMASCTAAIEEFCSASASMQESFHLEAALYCMCAVSDEVIAGAIASPHSSALKACIIALAKKPESLMRNALSLSQANIFLRKYAKVLVSIQANQILELATDLALTTFNLCSSSFPNEASSVAMRREAEVSPYSEAAMALKELLSLSPQTFVSNQVLTAIGAGWEASYTAANSRGIITTEDREAMGVGICHVLASLPDNQRAKSLLALAMPSLDCLEKMLQHADRLVNASREQIDAVLDRIGAEIIIVTTMVRSFSDAFVIKEASMELDQRASKNHVALHGLAIPIIKRAWPSISYAASNYNYNESISKSLAFFLTNCLPPDANSDTAVEFVRELCAIAMSIIQSESSRGTNFDSVLEFLEAFATIHGEMVDRHTRVRLQEGQGATGISEREREREVATFLETVLLSTLHSINQMLGSTWTSERQGNGQPAFETKATPKSPSRRETSNRALASMFSLLRVCAEQCPIFLLNLPAGPGLDRREDLLMRRAVDASAASLLESDVAASNGAIALLEATVSLTQSVSDEIRDVVEEILSTVRSDAVTSLVVGSCGKLHSGSLDNAARLLRCMLVASPSLEENQSNLVQAIGNENVFLGVHGKEVTLQFLLRSSRNENTDDDVSNFFHDIWELHQVETPESLQNSDAFIHFCKRYAR